MTLSAAIAGEHDKNGNSSLLVSVDAIALICAKLSQPAACFSAAAVTQMLDTPKIARVTLRSHR